MKHIVVVLTEPTTGREDEYNNYYENVHLDEVLATTDWLSAQRFKLSAQQGSTCLAPCAIPQASPARCLASMIANWSNQLLRF